MDSTEEDVKGMESSHEREHEGGERDSPSERANDNSDEHESSNEEQAQPQEESTNAAMLPKEIELQDNGKAFEKLEQDSQIKQTLQSVEPGTDQGADEGYKKTRIDPNTIEEMEH